MFKVNRNGSIENQVMLIYEVREEYLVCVEVVDKLRPTRVKRAFDESQMVSTDRIAYIIIRITDRSEYSEQNGALEQVESSFISLNFSVYSTGLSLHKQSG